MIQDNTHIRHSIAPNWSILLLEVFIRKNFGKNYFSLGKALLIWLKLTLFPLLITAAYLLYMRYKNPAVWHESPPVFIYHNFIRFGFISWYLFSIAYLIAVIKRHMEMPKSSDIDYEKSSAYGGDYHPWLLKKYGPQTTRRKFETNLEPMIFLVSGLVLALMGEYLGFLLMLAALVNRSKYKAVYKQADKEIQSRIDYNMAASWQSEIDENFIDYYKRKGVEQNQKPESERLFSGEKSQTDWDSSMQ
ncbi:MAG: hypothetical protein IPJ79_18665 [Bacteroidetes bacterium]|nr:hypothetical protein [Bacteroidota bacterium]